MLVNGDGESVGEPLVKGDFEVGRPPGIPQGASQRFMIAANLTLSLETPGPYKIIVRVDGADEESASFTAAPPAQPVASG